MPERLRGRPWLRWTLVGVLVVAAAVAAILIGIQLRTPVSVAGPVGTDEPVQFELTSGRCGYSEVISASGEKVLPETGMFCIARLNVRNLEEPRYPLDPSCQYMIDRSEEQHEPRLDDPVLIQLTDLEETLGPFEFKRLVALYYEVPEGTEMVAVELHSDCGSRGVRIPVAE